MMRFDPERLHYSRRLHPMACRCSGCRPRPTVAPLRQARAGAARIVRNIQIVWNTPFYDPAQRRFTLISRETIAVPVLVAPALFGAIALFLALQP